MVSEVFDLDSYNIGILPKEVKISTMTVYLRLNCILKLENINLFITDNDFISVENKLKKNINLSEIICKVSDKKKRIIIDFTHNFIKILGFNNFIDVKNLLVKLIDKFIESRLIDKSIEEVKILDFKVPLINTIYYSSFNFSSEDLAKLLDNLKFQKKVRIIGNPYINLIFKVSLDKSFREIHVKIPSNGNIAISYANSIKDINYVYEFIKNLILLSIK